MDDRWAGKRVGADGILFTSRWRRSRSTQGEFKSWAWSHLYSIMPKKSIWRLLPFWHQLTISVNHWWAQTSQSIKMTTAKTSESKDQVDRLRSCTSQDSQTTSVDQPWQASRVQALCSRQDLNQVDAKAVKTSTRCNSRPCVRVRAANSPTKAQK